MTYSPYYTEVKSLHQPKQSTTEDEPQKGSILRQRLSVRFSCTTCEDRHKTYRNHDYLYYTFCSGFESGFKKKKKLKKNLKKKINGYLKNNGYLTRRANSRSFFTTSFRFYFYHSQGGKAMSSPSTYTTVKNKRLSIECPTCFSAHSSPNPIFFFL